MTSPAVEARVDQVAAFVRDHLDAYGVDLSDAAQRKAVQATVLWFSAQFLVAHRVPSVALSVWELSCRGFAEMTE